MFKLEKLKDKAVLTIYGYVGGYWMDFRAVHAALAEVAKEGYKQLDFHIHTYGGDVFDGNLIINFLEGFKGEVDIYIDGVCASMGSIIATAGTRVHIIDNGFIMIHAPQGGARGGAKQMIQTAKLLTSIEKNFTSRLVGKTKKTVEEVKAWFDGTDYWFDADECISAGLADDKFTAKNDLKLDKAEAQTLGAEAVYNKFTAVLSGASPQNRSFTNPKSEMDKKAMIARYSLAGVTEESTDEQVLAAIDEKLKTEKAAATAAAAAANKQVISQIVAQAVADKLITDKQADEYNTHGEKLGADGLKAILANMKPYQPIAGMIAGKGAEGNPSAQDRKGWSWNDYQTKAPEALETMPKTDPELFKALYKAEYKSEPEL
jgi:ATP-dependent protease ClpP protease subunit